MRLVLLAVFLVAGWSRAAEEGDAQPPANAPPVITEKFPGYPNNLTVSPGSDATFAVTVTGTPPFTYQWLFDDVPIPNATNIQFTVVNAQVENAGHYRVKVDNAYGTDNPNANPNGTFSLFCPPPSLANATVLFQNGTGNRVFDVGGTNPLPSNAGYRAALLVGVQSNSLMAVPGAGIFGFGVPGVFSGGIKTISFLPAYASVFAQVLVWDANVAPTYTEAAARGGKHGASEIIRINCGGGVVPPGGLQNMKSFSLEQPSTASSAVARLASATNGMTLRVPGTAAGAMFEIQSSTDLVTWKTLGLVAHDSGVLRFSDPDGRSARRKFYRARLAQP